MQPLPQNSTCCRRDLLVRAGLLAGVVPLVGAIDGCLITPRQLVRNTHVFGTLSPLGVAPLRLLQISDLHLQRMGSLEQKVLEQLHDSQADVVAFTGDSLDRPAGLRHLESFLRECPQRPHMLAIVGNWEYRSGIATDTLRRLYEQHSIELLINRSIVIEKNGVRVRVTGLDDLIGGRPDAAAALSDGDSVQNHLVLAHCPATRDRLQMPAEHPASLVLSGHTHGGQVAPFGIALVRPTGSGRYVSGWYRDDGPPLYVSCGIGTSLLPVRIGATPEVVQIDWSLA